MPNALLVPSTSPTDDAGLVARVRAGDPDAEAELAARFGPRMRALCVAHTRSPELAADLAQDALIALLLELRRAGLRDASTLPAFAAGIARTIVRAEHRAPFRPDIGSLDADLPRVSEEDESTSSCDQYPGDEVVMRYVTGDLAEPEQSTFEDHVFACDGCLARVERHQGTRPALLARDMPAPRIVPSAARNDGGGSRRLPWLMLASAAVVLFALGGFLVWQRPAVPAMHVATAAPSPEAAPLAAPVEGPSPAPAGTPADGPASAALRVAVLAMVTPPPYLPPVTRGDPPQNERFTTGMAAYVRGDWPAASRTLREVDTAQARFYLGIADLMRGETVQAVTSLEAARRSGREPYARESLFYLGKAALQRGDVSRARESFTAAREAASSQADEAARLLVALDEVTAP